MLSLNGKMNYAIPSPPIAEQVSFRPVIERQDDTFLEELYFSAREDLHGLLVDPEQMRQLLLMQQKAQAIGYEQEFPNASYEVILVNADRAGRIVIDRSKSALAIIDIALLPSFRNRGIGSFILDLVLGECQRDARGCQLSVFKANRAMNLYLRKKFIVVEDMETHFLMEWTTR